MEPESEPVTVVVRRRVKAGRESDYEKWLADLIAVASSMPGYLGTHVHRPAPNGPGEYTSVYRFDSVDALLAFEQCDARHRALRSVADLVEADAAVERHTGLEFWFTPPPGTVVAQPSRFRMALLLVAVVYSLVLLIGPLVALAIGTTPRRLQMFVTITIEAFVMTYVLMPRLTKLLASWIYP